MVLLYGQTIQANAMCALIADIDGDGQNELIVALSDRVVRSYRAIQYGNGDDIVKLVGIHKWEFSDQIGSITLSTYWEYVVPSSATGSNSNGRSSSSSQKSESSTGNCLNIDSNERVERKSVLVAQHGGIFAKLHCGDVVPNDNLTLKDGEGDPDEEQAIGLTPEYKNITLPPLRNPQISADIISDIISNSKDQAEENKLIAVATADGLLMLLDEDNIRWQVQLEQKVASLLKHDIDNDGRDELVVCTWNGHTFFVNLDGRIVTCHFDQPVSSFTVGHYDINGYRKTCLAYGTFTNSVNLFYNLDCSFNIDTSDDVFLDYIRTNNSTLIDQLEMLVRKLNANNNHKKSQEGPSDVINVDEEDEPTQFNVDAKLINAILYGIPNPK